MPPAKKPPAKPETAAPISPMHRTPEHVIAELRRPFTADAIKWKVQTNPKGMDKSTMIVAFIDARLAGERLNAVIPGLWSTSYRELPNMSGPAGQGAVLCRITVRLPSGFTWHVEDVGVAPPQGGPEITVKGTYSDAFKRAAVHLGVGASMYALPLQYLKQSDGLRYWDTGKKDKFGNPIIRPYIEAKATLTLAKRYQEWLEAHGVKHFGEPLAHGESAGEQGDIETTPAQSPEDEPDTAAPNGADVVSATEAEELWVVLKDAGWTNAKVKNELTAEFGVAKLTELTRAQFDDYAQTCVEKIAEGSKS